MAGLGTGPWAAALATCEEFVKEKKREAGRLRIGRSRQGRSMVMQSKRRGLGKKSSHFLETNRTGSAPRTVCYHTIWQIAFHLQKNRSTMLLSGPLPHWTRSSMVC